MNDSRNEMYLFMKMMGKTLERLSFEQYSKLLNGKAQLIYKEIKEKPAPSETDKTLEIAVHIDKFNTFSSREEAYDYLISAKLNKAQISQICKSAQVHTLKSDKKSDLINKLIESLIGNKLRAQAIQNTDLKGNNENDY